MSKKLPGIFKKDVDVIYSNNKKIYYAEDTINNKLRDSNNNFDSNSLSVEEKLRKLFKSSRYIFNINVLIKTKNREYDTKIAGKVKDSVVTVDNDVIPIISIDDIIIKDRI